MNEVTTYYLEMKSPSALKAKEEANGFRIKECGIKQYQFNKFLYRLVGESWKWTDKLKWTDDQWRSFVENENLKTWVAYYKSSLAGYYELQRQEGGDVEIAYFGLIPTFIGQGFGGCLLSHAIKSAWGWEGARRVWVHTCTLDHPSALKNYIARGMTIYRTTIAYSP